jgi:hypothetical protein
VDIDAGNKTITIDNVDESFAVFSENSKVLIYHTQGDVVSKLNNKANFGRIGNIENTGKIEIVTLDAIERDNGIPVRLVLSDPLTLIPDLSENATVQVLSYPIFKGLTTEKDIVALAWNGYVGGILAFEVLGTLTLNHNILAEDSGFRGGKVSNNDGSPCLTDNYRSSDNIYGEKGEGIYKVVNDTYRYGKGAIANGGGGGLTHNAGGGGGSNFSSGGSGGAGWGCDSESGGIGAYSLSSFVANEPMMFFMGGGGGGGQQNNSNGTSGANGGGIILINADAIVVNSGNVRISANGADAKDTFGSGNDAAGGGGAAGSIILVAESVLVNEGASLDISVNGGNGGSVIHSASHGGGGGGAPGVVKTFGFDPYTVPNINVATLAGESGKDDNTSNPRQSANPAISADGVISYGIQEAVSLPVEITELKVKCTSTGAEITWATASEIDNDYFEIQKSEDMQNWTFVANIAGAYTTNEPNDYSFIDESISENQTYYRIRQTDVDGSFVYLDVLSILCQLDNSELDIIGVNASSSHVNVYIKTFGFNPVESMITDMSGKILNVQRIENPVEGANLVQFDANIPTGIYIVTFIQNNQRVSKKIYIN